MSSSQKLSTTQMGSCLGSSSKVSDKKLYECNKLVLSDLNKLNPDRDITHVRDFKINQILKDIKKKDENFQELQSNKSCIRPDGGIILLRINNRYYPLLASEMKKQGDGKLKPNGKPQASGNAIERANKNIKLFDTWLREEEINPYIIFAHGYDFKFGSSIIDRCLPSTNFSPFNEINLYKNEYNQGGASFYHRQEILDPYSQQELYEICLEIATKSIEYYIKKYE